MHCRLRFNLPRELPSAHADSLTLLHGPIDRPFEKIMSIPASSVHLGIWLHSIYDKNNKRLKFIIGEEYSCEDITTM